MTSIRLARASDSPRITEIYRPAVTDCATSFELEAPDEEEMSRRITACLRQFPWLVAEENHRVIGYAYASPHRTRAAYQWSAELSAYVDERAHRRGVGRALYEALMRVLVLQGYRNAYAGLTLPNEASEGFHRGLGFTPVGVFRHVGFKLGRWHDVFWLERSLLSDDQAPPLPPIPLGVLSESPLLGAAIEGRPTPCFRQATTSDVGGIQKLIEASVRGLSEPLYTRQQIDSALRYLFGPDSQLIADGSYYVAEVQGEIVASGGWSRRQTLHGGDQFKHGDDPLVDPRFEPARIRAFFVDPRWARQGIGRLLFYECSTAARAAGFDEVELTATLPGEQLYTTLGFTVVERGTVKMPDGVELPTARMRRSLPAASATPPESRSTG
jgi:L-amino acid N-acyltransferase YncA